MKRIVVVFVLLAIVSFAAVAGESVGEDQSLAFQVEGMEIMSLSDLDSIEGGYEAQETFDNGVYEAPRNGFGLDTEAAERASDTAALQSYWAELARLDALAYQKLYDAVHNGLVAVKFIAGGSAATLVYLTSTTPIGQNAFSDVSIATARAASSILGLIGFSAALVDYFIPVPNPYDSGNPRL